MSIEKCQEAPYHPLTGEDPELGEFEETVEEYLERIDGTVKLKIPRRKPNKEKSELMKFMRETGIAETVVGKKLKSVLNSQALRKAII